MALGTFREGGRLTFPGKREGMSPVFVLVPCRSQAFEGPFRAAGSVSCRRPAPARQQATLPAQPRIPARAVHADPHGAGDRGSGREGRPRCRQTSLRATERSGSVSCRRPATRQSQRSLTNMFFSLTNVPVLWLPAPFRRDPKGFVPCFTFHAGQINS